MPDAPNQDSDYQNQLIDLHEEMVRLLEKPNNFWHVNIGHVGTVMVMFVTLIGVYYKMDNRLENLEKEQLAIQQKAIELKAEINYLDMHGTQASQRGIYQETELSKANEREIEELQKVTREIPAKLERIDTNLSWVMKTMNIKPPDDGRKPNE